MKHKKIEYVDIESSPERQNSKNRTANASTYDIIKNNEEMQKTQPKKKIFPKMNGTLSLDHPEAQYDQKPKQIAESKTMNATPRKDR